MLRNSVSVTLLLLLLTACCIQHKQLDGNPAYLPHQYKNADMNIGWISEKQDNSLRINGTITNARADSVYENVELEATLLDSQGNVLAKKLHTISPIRLDASEQFSMLLPLESGAQPEQIHFNYRYGIGEDRFSVKFVSKP